MDAREKAERGRAKVQWAIIKHGPTSRRDLGRLLPEINEWTLNNYLRELRKAGRIDRAKGKLWYSILPFVAAQYTPTQARKLEVRLIDTHAGKLHIPTSPKSEEIFKRRAETLRLLSAAPLRRSDIIKSVSGHTAGRCDEDLRALLELGAIKRIGSGPQTKYTRTQESTT